MPEFDENQTDTSQLNAYRGKLLLEQKIKQLQDSLANRSNMPFDPMWMKIAEGFLAPTKTGGFGESAGYAASGAVEAAEKERARKVDTEKLQLELATKQYELEKQARAQQLLQSGLAGTPFDGTKKTTLSTQNETSTLLGTTPATPTEAVNIAKSNPSDLSSITMTPQLVGAISAFDKDTGAIAAKIMEGQQKNLQIAIDQRKANQSAINVSPRGIYDVESQTWKEKAPQPPVKYPHPFDQTNKEGILIPYEKQSEYEKALANGDENAIRQILASTGQPGYTGKKFISGETNTELPLTAAEVESKAAGEKKTAEERATLSVKDEQGLRSAHQQAPGVIAASNNLSSIATSNPRIFDLLQGTDMSEAIQRTITRGLQTPGGSISIDMHDIAAASKKLPPEDRTAAMLAAQNYAQLQLSFAKTFLQGQGAVSDNERKLGAQASIDSLDNATAIRLKAEALRLRAEQDSKIYKTYIAYRKSHKGATLDDFYADDDVYGKLVNDYEARLERVRESNARLLSGVPGINDTSKATKNPKSGSLYDKVKEEGY